MRQREAKQKQEENDAGKRAYAEDPRKRDEEDHLKEQRDYRRERPREDKERGSKNFSYQSSKQDRRCEKPFLSPLKAGFWKPNEDGFQGSKRPSPSSQLLTPSSMSRGFRKPGGSDDAIPRWRKAQPKEESGKGALDEKQFKTETSIANKEEDIPRWCKTQPKEGTGKGALDEKQLKTEISIASKEEETRGRQEKSREDALGEKEALYSNSSCLRYLVLFWSKESWLYLDEGYVLYIA